MSCERFMVKCNYDPKQAELQAPYVRKAEPLEILDSVSLNDALLEMINGTLLANYPKGYGQPLQMDLQDLERLRRWQTRTVLTIGSPATAKIYQKECIKSVSKYPYLIHSILALTTKHDRHLARHGFDDPRHLALEYFHTGRAAALFNLQLSQSESVQPSTETDMLWCTGVFLGSLASGTVDGTTPEDVWPLKDGTTGEALSWLRIHEGMRLLWYLSQPFAPGRMFNELVNTPDHAFIMTKLDPVIPPGIDGIPPDFVELCNMDENSTLDNHPYQKAVRTLMPLLDLEWNGVNRLKFMSFSAMMDSRYKQLLKEKEPAALVLLAWWYALVLRSQWYLARRASLECRSICIYLSRKCPDNTLIQRLLRFPQMRTGLLCEDFFTEVEVSPWTLTNSKWGAIVIAQPNGNTSWA
jgi:hypothetical protein